MYVNQNYVIDHQFLSFADVEVQLVLPTPLGEVSHCDVIVHEHFRYFMLVDGLMLPSVISVYGNGLRTNPVALQCW